MKTLAAALVLAAATPALAQTAEAPPTPAAAALPAPPPPIPAAALPAPPPPPIPAAPLAPAPKAYGKSEGVLPGMVIGPKLSILSLPAPGFGIEAKYRNVLGLSFGYDLIPTVTIDDVSAGYTDWNLAAKWYPWRGAFFLGAALGNRSFDASATDVVDGVSVKATVEVESTYFAPELGWRWVWDSGFFMGMDLGYQVILSSKTTLGIPSGAEATTVAQDVTDAGDDIGKIGLPIVSLLQVGWFF